LTGKGIRKDSPYARIEKTQIDGIEEFATVYGHLTEKENGH
jgi:hypothetical protein